MTGTALVLGGGGVGGIAWELGVLRGLADADPALADRILAADLVVGTSAGASVAAQITSGVPLDELYEAQLRAETAEIDVALDQGSLFESFAAAMAGATGPEDAGRRMGTLALAADTVEPAVRLRVVDARLPVKQWPDRRVLVTVVDAETGERRAFDRDSGVSLLDAVAASGAVPGVWPPSTIGGRRYIDGGAWTMTNADLAAGAERVLVLQPLETPPMPWVGGELAALARARVHVIRPDEASLAAFGTNALSPATRGPAARAGRALGNNEAPSVTRLFA